MENAFWMDTARIFGSIQAPRPSCMCNQFIPLRRDGQLVESIVGGDGRPLGQSVLSVSLSSRVKPQLFGTPAGSIDAG